MGKVGGLDRGVRLPGKRCHQSPATFRLWTFGWCPGPGGGKRGARPPAWHTCDERHGLSCGLRGGRVVSASSWSWQSAQPPRCPPALAAPPRSGWGLQGHCCFFWELGGALCDPPPCSPCPAAPTCPMPMPSLCSSLPGQGGTAGPAAAPPHLPAPSGTAPGGAGAAAWPARAGGAGGAPGSPAAGAAAQCRAGINI